MKRLKNFGDLSVDKQLDLLEDGLEKNDILLFQFYGMIDEYTASQEIIDEYFENYCDDVIYYYNPQIQKEIQQDILDVFIKNRAIYGEKGNTPTYNPKELYNQIKKGDYTNVSKEEISIIKKLVFYKLMKYNIDEKLHKYIDERAYGKSQWILTEQGKINSDSGVIWYKPFNRKETLETLEKFPLFSCIVLKDGELLDNFSRGYVVEETASNYDLLIFENN